jgi:hypothetical protein
MSTWNGHHVLVALLFATLVGSGASCVVVHDYPPDRPDDGYVFTGPDVDLVFAASIGVYYVSGHPDCYYYGGHYYRRRGDRWETAPRWRGRWERCPHNRLPPGLAKRR